MIKCLAARLGGWDKGEKKCLVHNQLPLKDHQDVMYFHDLKWFPPLLFNVEPKDWSFHYWVVNLPSSINTRVFFGSRIIDNLKNMANPLVKITFYEISYWVRINRSKKKNLYSHFCTSCIFGFWVTWNNKELISGLTKSKGMYILPLKNMPTQTSEQAMINWRQGHWECSLTEQGGLEIAHISSR